MIYRVRYPDPEGFSIEDDFMLFRTIQLWEVHHGLGATSSVEQSDCQRRQCREKYVVHRDCPSFEQRLAGPSRVDSEPHFDKIQAYVLMKRIQDQFAQPIVIPGTVHEQQTAQKTELQVKTMVLDFLRRTRLIIFFLWSRIQ